ncbi:MAG: LysM peptidoglycan-binding domain-containing protein [Micavibrio sp.]
MRSLSVPSVERSPDPAQSATIAPLGRRETDPVAGARRRNAVAAVLGMATGVGSVMVVKSAAAATAAWVGAPAIATIAITGLATMAAAGSVDYFIKRKALKAAGQDVPAFSFAALAKNIMTSRAALMGGGMTVLATVAPATALMAVGGFVAGLGAGLNDYFGQRKALKAAGQDVPAFSWRDMLKTVNHSKGAKIAFGVSMLTALGLSAVSEMMATPPAVDMPVAAPNAALAPASDFAAAATPEAAASVEPAAGVEAPAEVAPVAAVPATQDYIAEYTLQKGDNLWHVASDVLGSDATAGEVLAKVKEIAALNNIPDPDFVRAGDVIQLPVADADAATLERLQGELPGLQLNTADSLDTTLAEAQKNYVPQERVVAPVVTEVPASVPAAPAEISAAAAPVEAAPAKPVSIGSCYVTETPTNLNFDCRLDPQAVVQPGAGVDFYAAAQGEQPFRVSLSAGSAPMNAQEFLSNFAVPEAEEAFRNDRFEPRP